MYVCITACIHFIRLVFVCTPTTAMIPHIKIKYKGFLYLCICILAELISPFGITFVIRTSQSYTVCSCYQRPARDVGHELCPVINELPCPQTHQLTCFLTYTVYPAVFAVVTCMVRRRIFEDWIQLTTLCLHRDIITIDPLPLPTAARIGYSSGNSHSFCRTQDIIKMDP